MTHLTPVLTLTHDVPLEVDMLILASRLAEVTTMGAVIFLSGPLGAGKTTFARGFLRALQYVGKVKSPSYTLVESYDLKQGNVFHFDFYRADNVKMLSSMGIQEYFLPTSICLIEWPENAASLLPDPDLACYIAFVESGRKICSAAYSEVGKRILQNL
jgi:tRNA threonylcarbamoyladenosine biosynthesis protein TsaE